MDEKEEVYFNITVSQTLSKNVSVSTDDYISEIDETEDGKHLIYDTDETDWKSVFKNNKYHTPIELIGILKEILEETYKKGIVLYGTPNTTRNLIKECSDWCIDDEAFVE